MNNPATNKSPSIESYVDQLIADKGLDYLETDVLKQVKADLAERVEERINAVVIEKMPPEKMEFFEKMIGKSNAEEVQAFVQRNVPDIEKNIALELAEFRKTYLNL